VRYERVRNAITEEIQASAAGVTVSGKAIDEFLLEFGKEIEGSMEEMQHEFNVNREAVAAYIG